MNKTPGTLHIAHCIVNETIRRYCLITINYVFKYLMIAHKYEFMFNIYNELCLFRSINYN